MSHTINGDDFSFNPDHQTRFNGELAEPLRMRIKALLASSSKISLASIARTVELSPTFTSGLVRGEKAIRTRHMPRFIAAIERLEQQVSPRPNVTFNTNGASASAPSTKLVELMAEVAATLPSADRIYLLRRIAGMA